MSFEITTGSGPSGAPAPLRRGFDADSPLSRSVLELSNDCVKIIDGEGRLMFMNYNGLCIMEIDDFNALRGQPWPSLWPEAERAKVAQSVSDALTRGAAHFVAQCPTAKGNWKWWDVTVTAIPSEPGAPQRLVSVSRDISAEKAAEEAFRKNHERLELLARTTSDVLWELDFATRKVWWSEGARSVFGYARNDVPSDHLSYANLIHPDDRDRVMAGMIAARDSGATDWADTFRYRRADGGHSDVTSRAVIQRDDKGRALRMFGSLQDITERVRHEEVQKTLVDEMAHRVNNTLAAVQAVVTQTARSSSDPKALVEAVQRRVAAMVAANRTLLQSTREGADLKDLIVGQLGAYIGDGARIAIDGPAVKVPASVASSLALVIHELATNAAKYGALSRDTGSVDLIWSVIEASGVRKLKLLWTERGGPQVEPPKRRGFGSVLIDRGVRGGEVERTFAPDGVVCTIALPL